MQQEKSHLKSNLKVYRCVIFYKVGILTIYTCVMKDLL